MIVFAGQDTTESIGYGFTDFFKLRSVGESDKEQSYSKIS